MPADSQRIAGRIFSAQVDEGSFLGVAGFCLGKPSTNSAAILTLGDAWGMIPPFTGNGMSMAFESAAIALEPLRSWQRGRETWEQALSRIQNRLAERFARRMFWARIMHPFLTTAAGQAFFTFVSRSGLLPFQSLRSRGALTNVPAVSCQRLSRSAIHATRMLEDRQGKSFSRAAEPPFGENPRDGAFRFLGD